MPGANGNSRPGVFDFRHACDHHDGCYQGLDRFGKNATISRRSCDNTFLADMNASCREQHRFPLFTDNGRRCLVTAQVYHAAVRALGQPYYRGSGSKA